MKFNLTLFLMLICFSSFCEEKRYLVSPDLVRVIGDTDHDDIKEMSEVFESSSNSVHSINLENYNENELDKLKEIYFENNKSLLKITDLDDLVGTYLGSGQINKSKIYYKIIVLENAVEFAIHSSNKSQVHRYLNFIMNEDKIILNNESSSLILSKTNTGLLLNFNQFEDSTLTKLLLGEMTKN